MKLKLALAALAGVGTGLLLPVSLGRSQEAGGPEAILDDPTTPDVDESLIDDLRELEAPTLPGSAGETANVTPTKPCWMTYEGTFTASNGEDFKRYRIPVGYARGHKLSSGTILGVAEAYYNGDAGACGWGDSVDGGDPPFVACNDKRFEIFLFDVWAIDSWPASANDPYTFKFALQVREGVGPPGATCLEGALVGTYFDASYCAWDNEPGVTLVRQHYWAEGVDWPMSGSPTTPWSPDDTGADCHRPEIHLDAGPTEPVRLGPYTYQYTIWVYQCTSPTSCPTTLDTEIGCFTINWVDCTP